MTQNEILQWTIAGVIVLIAILWAAIKILQMARSKNSGNSCSCCGESSDCKAKELKQIIEKNQCGRHHDGQSARN